MTFTADVLYAFHCNLHCPSYLNLDITNHLVSDSLMSRRSSRTQDLMCIQKCRANELTNMKLLIKFNFKLFPVKCGTVISV